MRTSNMNGWQRWVRAPQTIGFRKALMQVHLWMGLGFGVYLFLISLSGSAVVLRPEFGRWFIHSEVTVVEGAVFEGERLAAAVEKEYFPVKIERIIPPRFPNRAVYVVLESNGITRARYFDQYQGVDLGSNRPWPVIVMEWLVDFHDNLLAGETGRDINGLGGGLLVLMLLSGAVLWWPGRTRWKFSVFLKQGGRHSWLWQMHSIVGIWVLMLMLIWGVTAVYFAMPAPFEDLIDWLDDDLNDFERPEGFLLWLIKMHFGRFGGLWGRIGWIVLGLVPAFMYVSGFILWWKRVVRKESV